MVAPLTRSRGCGHSLGRKVMMEMGRNEESSAHLHTMLFKEEKMSTQAMNRQKREEEEWKQSEGPCSQEM